MSDGAEYKDTGQYVDLETDRTMARPMTELEAAANAVFFSGVPGPNGSLLIPASAVHDLRLALAMSRRNE